MVSGDQHQTSADVVAGGPTAAPGATGQRSHRWFRAAVLTIGLAAMALGTVPAYFLLRAAPDVTPIARPVITSEALLRDQVVTSVRPACPADFVQSERVAVTVATVHLSADGGVLHVDVLEAPTPSLAATVTDALRQWRFRPPEDIGNRRSAVAGRLTFYATMLDGTCQILYPREAPYLGRWPTKADPTRGTGLPARPM